jgi:hypothetical protein
MKQPLTIMYLFCSHFARGDDDIDSVNQNDLRSHAVRGMERCSALWKRHAKGWRKANQGSLI